MNLHKCQIVKKAFLSFLFFALFFKWSLFGVFFLVSVSSFLAFFRVFAVGCVISFSWCGRRAALFSVGAFCVRFCLCFLFFSGFFGFLFGSGYWAAALLFFPSGFWCAFLFVFSLLFGLFWVPFWLWVLGAVLLFFPSGFLCAFLFVFSLPFRGVFGFLFGSGCWGPCCSFFRRAFCVRSCLCFPLLFVLFWVPSWLWVLGAVLLFFPSGFLCAFLFVFSLPFRAFLGSCLIWVLAPCCSFFRRAFCVRFCLFFSFYETNSFIF